MIRGVVNNPDILEFPALQRSQDGKSFVIKLTDFWFESRQDEKADSLTKLVIKNKRDIDIVIAFQESSNQFAFIDEKNDVINSLLIPKHSLIETTIRYTVENRFFKNKKSMESFESIDHIKEMENEMEMERESETERESEREAK